MDSTSDTKLPDVIKIDDITSGKIDPNLIYNELERLKVEINILRNDMSLFIKALATIPQNQSQQEYYRVVASRLKTVQASIKDYCAQYNKLLPIINLGQIKLGHEVEILPQSQPTRLSTSNGSPNNNKGASVNGKNGKRNSLSNKSNGTNNGKAPNSGNTTNAGVKTGSNANQPIVL